MQFISQKRLFWRASFLLLPTLLLSCSHLSPEMAATDEAPNWMDADDHVRYVEQMSRMPSEAPSKYKITGTCGGFPQVDVKTAPGFCLGLVADGDGILKKPRTTAVTGPNEVVLVDMASWNPYDGKIYLLSWSGGKSNLKEILSSKSFPDKSDPRREITNRPHQVTKGPDGRYYVGSATHLLRFDPKAQNPASTVEVMIAGMPAQGLHPLKSFAFDDHGNIFINVGSATNTCQKMGKGGENKKSCDEVENRTVGQAQIRRYQFQADGRVGKDFEIYAKGLRNSVALTWDPDHQILLEGDNGRDAIDKLNPRLDTKGLPHEELNIVERGKHYGWPYCYDKNQNNPEWSYMDCSGYTAPHLLLPPHSAPLALQIYRGNLFPAWYKNRLLIGLHGYESKGHRIGAFKRDDRGYPTGVVQSIVYGWDTKGAQKVGSPVGLTELSDGSVLIVEDNSKKVLRLFYDASLGNGTPVQEVDQDSAPIDPEDPVAVEARKKALEGRLASAKPPAFTLFQNKVIDKTCYACHSPEGSPGVRLLQYDDIGNAARIKESGKASEILEIFKGNPSFPPMPPQGFDSDAEQKEAAKLFEAWMKSK